MSAVQLYAVTDDGPRAVPIRAGSREIHELFDDLPVGVYTALCTFGHNKFLHLEDHLDRLEQSMALLGWDYRLDRWRLRQALHQVCTAYPLPNARVRLDVLAEPALDLGGDERDMIALSPFEPLPEQVYEQGVRVGIAQKLSRDRPLIKKAEFVFERRKCFDENPNVYECLLLDDRGCMLEGTTSNFYAVRDGVLWTAGSGVLQGVARKIILNVAREQAIPVRLEPVSLGQVKKLDEAALSSSSRAIIPIVQIGDQTVGDGRPGPVTRKLLHAYNDYVARAIRLAIDGP